MPKIGGAGDIRTVGDVRWHLSLDQNVSFDDAHLGDAALIPATPALPVDLGRIGVS